ncbi:D-amino-acid dehydrogenase [Robiginitalea myxolifaciens]|uniref:D-amino-acid dehydrogenase n=1 Tax=Robiginitalea myxolifaciens TaxID=400055 RepID=A0A1I6H6H3_9FLAO|nr:FAD-dependent oxidoreductase [Robiginitalea myxolifaciens]SFR49901.1 D-amino-acid dehydrogenase [Robiginitalea myxolifaciens]
MSKKVVIVGGGIMGLSSAYYLQKAGHQVTIVDQGSMDSGASYVNAGYLTPSHIVPLAAPGVMAKGLKWMWNSSSPFYLKPRLDWDFLRWSWEFYRSSTRAKVARAIPLIAEINLQSKALYSQWLASGEFGSFQLEHTGLLMLAKSEASLEAERQVMHRAGELGLEARELDRSELLEVQPGLRDEVAGAIHFLCDSHTTPVQLMPRIQEALKKSGVEFEPNVRITGFKKNGEKVSAVLGEKSNGQGDAEVAFSADEVVLASGAWTPELMKTLGLRLSLQAGKGYRIDLKRPTPITLPAVLMESKVAITPMSGFTRFAGTMELSGVNHKIRMNRVRAIADGVASYYKDLNAEESELQEASCGLRPVSPDGLPYIGRPGGWKNVILATGHAMMGWSLGPITGKLVSEITDNQKPSVSLEDLHPDRRF